MGELRAALAVARRDVRNLSRYRFLIAAQIFTPLYQGVIPAFLFGASFAVSGRAVGLERTIGTADLAGFIFLGGIMSGLIATTFWGMAMSIRNEMDVGTLEPSWLTPTGRGTLVFGRAIGSLLFFAAGQAVILTVGVLLFGLRFRTEIFLAVPAMLLAVVAMVGVAYGLAAIVLLIKEANFFVDTTNFLFATASGVAFPITLLPGVLQPIAYAFPTTYAMDILRQHALGTRPLLDPILEYAILIAGTVAAYPLGRWALGAAERRMRVRGTVGQY